MPRAVFIVKAHPETSCHACGGSLALLISIGLCLQRFPSAHLRGLGVTGSGTIKSGQRWNCQRAIPQSARGSSLSVSVYIYIYHYILCINIIYIYTIIYIIIYIYIWDSDDLKRAPINPQLWAFWVPNHRIISLGNMRDHLKFLVGESFGA